MSRKDTIERAAMAALMHAKPDYRSPKRLNEMAVIISDFVEGALLDDEKEAAKAKRETCEHPRKQGGGTISSDGSGSSVWYCPDCLKSGSMKWPARAPLTTN